MFVSACDLVHRFLDMASQSVYIILYRLIYHISYYVLSIVSSSQLSGHGIPVRSQPQFDSALTLVTHCIALLPRGVGGHVTPRICIISVCILFVFLSTLHYGGFGAGSDHTSYWSSANSHPTKMIN